MGGVQTPTPKFWDHNFSPLVASKASNQPFISPVKTRLLAVARTPPYMGSSVLFCQAILPVLTLMAVSVPSTGNWSVGEGLCVPPTCWPTVGVPGTYLGKGKAVTVKAWF